MRSVCAKKRKEGLLPLPSNVGKLGFKAKRIISESLENEAELVVSWLPDYDSKSTDVDIADEEGIGSTLSDGGDVVVLSSTLAKSLELRHKIAHLKSIFGGGSKVSDDEPDQEVVRSFELQGTIDGMYEDVEADDTVEVVENAASHGQDHLKGGTHESVSSDKEEVGLEVDGAADEDEDEEVDHEKATSNAVDINLLEESCEGSSEDDQEKTFEGILDSNELAKVRRSKDAAHIFPTQTNDSDMGLYCASVSANRPSIGIPRQNLSPDMAVHEPSSSNTNENELLEFDPKVDHFGTPKVLARADYNQSQSIPNGQMPKTPRDCVGPIRTDHCDPSTRKVCADLIDRAKCNLMTKQGPIVEGNKASLVEKTDRGLVGALNALPMNASQTLEPKPALVGKVDSPCIVAFNASPLKGSSQTFLMKDVTALKVGRVAPIVEVGPSPTVASSNRNGSHFGVAGHDDVAHLMHVGGPAFQGSDCQVASNLSQAGWTRLARVGSTTSFHVSGTDELSQAHNLAVNSDNGGPANVGSIYGATINTLGAHSVQDDHFELGGPRLAGIDYIGTSDPTGRVNSQPHEVKSIGPILGPSVLLAKDVDPVSRLRGDNLAGNSIAGLFKPSSFNLSSDDQVRLDGIGKSWAGLFKPTLSGFGGSNNLTGHSTVDGGVNISQADFKLEYVDHGEPEAKLVLKMPKDLTIAGQEEWRATLVGRFLGKKLPYSLVTNVTARLWANEGLTDTLATDSGYFFFTFSCEENRDAVLEGGPWFVAGQPLLLRPWKPHFSFGNEEVHTIPIWVNFYGVPLEYWNPKGISFISSFIGKPIRVDRTTASRRRITYARVCIEVNTDFDFFNEFHIESEDVVTGKTLRTRISLEYQWIPIRCKQCSQFGHDCSRTAKPVNRPSTHFPKERNGKETGEWRVVARRDKGKKPVESNSHCPKDTVQRNAPLEQGNMFDALTKHLEVVEADPIIAGSLVPSSVRMTDPAASSSSYPVGACEEVREDPACLSSVDGLDDCEVDYGLDGEIGSVAMGSPLSNRQKKKVAKMKFSGSRPKGRHRH